MKIIFSIFSLFLFSQQIIAQKPGTIDMAYGPNDTGSATINNSIFAKTSTLQPDNKLLLAGYDPLTTKYCVMRLTKDGLADESFGENGKVTTTADGLFPDTLYMNGWTAITLQSDNKIVTAGVATHYNPDVAGEWGGPWDNDIIIGRFLPDGSPDMSFGSQGRIFTDLGLIENIRSIVIQPDGKILVAGWQDEDSDGDGSRIILVRYNSEGTPDLSFGSGKGYFKYTTTNSFAYTVLLQPDGKIITGGAANANVSFLTMRFNANGSVDSGFGKKGEVITSFKTGGALGTRITSMVLDKNGKILVTGPSATYANGQVVRYMPDGSLDSTFDGDGKLQLNKYGYSYLYPSEVMLQPGNKMVISGFIWTNTNSKMLVQMALDENGLPDTAFGENAGYTLSPAPSSIYRDYSNSFVQTDGKIVMAYAGFVGLTNDTYNTSIRYLGYNSKHALIVKIRRWLQHHNGIVWDDVPGAKSYVVQRSSNGVQWVTDFGSRRSAKSQQPSANSYSDPSPLPGTNYYRLETTGIDGALAYSNIIAISNQPFAVSVSPNPAKSVLRIEGLPAGRQAKITVVSLSGNVVISQQLTSNGSSHCNLNIAALKPGNYLLNIEAEGTIVTKQFVKE